MKFSTLDHGSITWTQVVLKDHEGEIIADRNCMTLHTLVIINDSANDRIFRINKGAPFLVRDGEAFTYGLGAQLTARPGPIRIDMDSATFTGITIYGE